MVQTLGPVDIPSLKSPVLPQSLRRLVFECCSDYQRIRLFRHDLGHALFLNETIQWESREEEILNHLMVSVPLGLLREPRSVLILGGGFGLGARTALNGGAQRVDVLEIDPEVVRLSRQSRALRKLNGAVFDDPRVHVRIGDVFEFVPEQRYELIVFDCDVSATRQRPDADVSRLVNLLLGLRDWGEAVSFRIPVDGEYLEATDQLDGGQSGDQLQRTAALVRQFWPKSQMLEFSTTYCGRELYVWNLPDYIASSLTTEYVSRVTSAGISS